MPYEHASASFAWKAGAEILAVDVDSDLKLAYEEVRAGKGIVLVRGLPLDRRRWTHSSTRSARWEGTSASGFRRTHRAS